jgi:hypothetical protein
VEVTPYVFANKKYINNCFFIDHKYIYFSSKQNALDFNYDKHVLNNILIETKIIKETDNFLSEKENISNINNNDYNDFLNNIAKCDSIVKKFYHESKSTIIQIENIIDQISSANYLKMDNCKIVIDDIHDVMRYIHKLKIDIGNLKI